MNRKLTATLLCPVLMSPALALDLVPIDAVWDYMHPTDGVDPAVADADFDATWYLPGPNFDLFYDGPEFGAEPAVAGPPFDSGSGAAPISYGAVGYLDGALGGAIVGLTPPDEGLRATAYFRHEFVTLAAVDQLALEILADDGAAIYIDGNLFETINFNDPDTYGAFSVVGGDETAPRVVVGGLGGLAVGTHTIAVSVHQVNANSSDLGFAMRLSDDGLSGLPMGETDFGGTVIPFLLASDTNGWVNTSPAVFLLDDADGATIRSEAVDISGRGELLFTMDFVADETSTNSNFEEVDTFSARLELDDGIGGISNILLVPAGLDSDADGILAGAEFAPGVPDDVDAELKRPLVARIPAGSASATLVIEAVNNSTTEMYTFQNALFSDVLPAGGALGTAEIGLGEDIPLLLGPGLWTETAEKVFELNDSDADTVLMSEDIDISTLTRGLVTLTFDASETSTASNFENGDSFAAWVETVDGAGLGVAVYLVEGGTDADGDHVLRGDEYAPGALDEEEVSRQFALSARLPEGAVSARIVIVADNNAASETFTLSDVLLREAPPIAPAFDVTGVALVVGTGVEVTWESEAGAVYDLQFSADLANGSFATVETVTAIGASTTATHDPGAVVEGFYRVSRRP